MKTLSCKDMGHDDDYQARGFTTTEVIDDMIEHHHKAHSDSGKSDDELRNEMRGKIRDE